MAEQTADLIRAGRRCRYCAVIVMLAGALATPPIVTTTACVPNGAAAGMRTLICVTPTRPAGIPMNCMGASIPAMETARACAGAGNCATGTPGFGAAPVAIDGDTAPAPVRNIVTTPPRAALPTTTAAPLPSVNRPGAAD